MPKHCDILMPSGEIVPLHDRCCIGRDPDNTILLDHPTVSRWHAVIVRSSRFDHCLMDLDTKNGTYLNGVKITTPVFLHDGDQITIERDTLKFKSMVGRNKAPKSAVASTVRRNDSDSTQTDELYVPLSHGILVLSADFSIDAMSPSAILFMARYFSAEIETGGPLPAMIGDWLQTNSREIQDGIALPPSIPPLESKKGERVLYVEVQPGIEGTCKFLLLIEKEPLFTLEKVKREFAPRFELTERQAEVTYYTALGKDNEEISITICCAKRTVGKHLERIYEKVGVENRKALARFVIDFFHR